MTMLEGTLAVQQPHVPNANDNAGSALSWTQQDGTLRDLWGQNLTPDQIADSLGRSVAAVMTRAARLGLPRRFAPGRKPLVKGTAVVQRQRPAKTFSQEMFKEILGPGISRAMRTCLMCVNPFQSQGSHNRICPRCKGSPDYEAGNRLPDSEFFF